MAVDFVRLQQWLTDCGRHVKGQGPVFATKSSEEMGLVL